jgi:hypothetical protein
LLLLRLGSLLSIQTRPPAASSNDELKARAAQACVAHVPGYAGCSRCWRNQPEYINKPALPCFLLFLLSFQEHAAAISFGQVVMRTSA